MRMTRVRPPGEQPACPIFPPLTCGPSCGRLMVIGYGTDAGAPCLHHHVTGMGAEGFHAVAWLLVCIGRKAHAACVDDQLAAALDQAGYMGMATYQEGGVCTLHQMTQFLLGSGYHPAIGHGFQQVGGKIGWRGVEEGGPLLCDPGQGLLFEPIQRCSGKTGP